MRRPAHRLTVIAMVAVVAAIFTMTAHGSATPIKSIPKGPITAIATSPGQLTAVALPHPSGAYRGYVWRLARRYDKRVVREVGEADVGSNVVVIYRIVGRGRTALVFGLTHGDNSPTAVKSITHRIRAN